MKIFSKLQLNKKSIAKMNDTQLNSVRGGQNAIATNTIVINCNVYGATVILPDNVA